MPLVTIRLTDEEKARFDKLIERSDARAPKGFNATQRSTFLAALDAFEAYLNKLDADKNRPR